MNEQIFDLTGGINILQVCTKTENEQIMSFGINGPKHIPGIQEAQNMKNNGGGGNLGYFKRQNKEKKKKDEIDVFHGSVDENDEFIPDAPEQLKDESILKKASEFIKNFKTKKYEA